MGSVSLLSHVSVHFLEPVDPALELDQVGGVGLHRQVDRGLGLVDDDGEPVLGQGRDVGEDPSPEERVTVMEGVTARSYFELE